VRTIARVIRWAGSRCSRMSKARCVSPRRSSSTSPSSTRRPVFCPPATHERAVVQAGSIFVMTELEAPAIESYRQREANPEASAKAATRYADAVAAAKKSGIRESNPLLELAFVCLGRCSGYSVV